MIIRLAFAAILFLGLTQTTDKKPAGGDWTETQSVDEISGSKSQMFVLPAKEAITDGLKKATPNLVFGCTHFKDSSLVKFRFLAVSTGISVGLPDENSGKIPHKHVRARIDDTPYEKESWELGHNDLTVPPDLMVKVLKSKVFLVQFEGADGNDYTVKFSPLGINEKILADECDFKLP